MDLAAGWSGLRRCPECRVSRAAIVERSSWWEAIGNRNLESQFDRPYLPLFFIASMWLLLIVVLSVAFPPLLLLAPLLLWRRQRRLAARRRSWIAARGAQRL